MIKLNTMTPASEVYYNAIINHPAQLAYIKENIGVDYKNVSRILINYNKVNRESVNCIFRGCSGIYKSIWLNLAVYVGMLDMVQPSIFTLEKHAIDVLIKAYPTVLTIGTTQVKEGMRYNGAARRVENLIRPPLDEAERYALEALERHINPPAKDRGFYVEQSKTNEMTWSLQNLAQSWGTTEESKMKFITIEKQLLVDGSNIYTMSEDRLLALIEKCQQGLDNIKEVDFESSRLDKEQDKLAKLMKKLIKLLDAKS